MFEPADISSLTEFQRSTKTFVERLQRSGRPEVLTINGKAALVIQDAEAFAQMLDQLERACTVESLRVGLEQFDAGKGIPLAQFERDFRKRSKLAKRKRRSA